LRKLRSGQTIGRRVRCRLALGDLRRIRLFAFEDRSDVGDRARRRDEGRANFERRVGGRRGILWRRWSGDAGRLLLLFTYHARPYDRAAACLARLFQLGANGGFRIADFATHAGAQFFHMRLPARLDDLLVRGGVRIRK
jgi:hypothetical protein